MLAFILWYVTISLLGLLTFPLAYRLFPALADRGYAFSRVLGLLLWGYVFWLLASLGVLRNDIGGLLLALGVALTLSLWAWRGIPRAELTGWLNERRGLIIGVEILFLLAFAGWAFVRSANPEIAGTEKPMELAFINAILGSPEFPPHDPWLSGYAISYYYFGYVLVAMLAKLTATTGSMAFNLAVSLVFALSAVGAYGVVYDLLQIFDFRLQISKSAIRNPQSAIYALLGPFFLIIISNFEGFLHSLHTRGVLWGYNAAGQLTSGFWQWLDIKDLNQPPAQPFSWTPTQFWWWWRASRVVQDYDLAGHWKEIIDEFPFFSYLLGDLHPHVLAMPFALLAVALSLNLFLGGGRGRLTLWRWQLFISPLYFLFSAVALGGLAFLNTWDFPIYVALFCGAYVLGRVEDGKSGRWEERKPGRSDGAAFTLPSLQPSGAQMFKELILLGFSLGLAGGLLYLPFYLGFSSQAGGILPNLISPTRGAHLWVMFGPLLLPIFAFLLYLWKRAGNKNGLKKGVFLALGGMVALWGLSLLLGWAITRLGQLGNLYLDTLGARGQPDALFQEAFIRRLTSAGGWLTLAALLAATVGLFWPKTPDSYPLTPNLLTPTPYLFTLLLILFGGLLVLAPEFFFLRDQFGWRMNTIFKFYYQAWILWSLAAAYATATLWQTLRGGWGWAFRAGAVLVMGMALFYPAMALQNKTNSFNPPEGFTLDGGAYLERQSPDEMAAIRWLRTAPPGVVLEAVGGSYTSAARVATYSGQPTVLGWPGHESQWRGGARGWENRQSDVETIFRSNDWNAVQELLRKYNVRYIFIGDLERSTYRVNEIKFQRFLSPVFQQGQVTIYAAP